MKKIDAGQMISILANVGVIAGILFLGVEIRNSQQQALVANTLQATTEISLWIRSIGEDPEQAALFRRGSEDFHGLTESEQFQFDLLMRSGVMQFSLGRFARDSGLAALGQSGLEQRVLEGNLIRLWSLPGVQQWWAGADKRGIPAPTIEMIDDLAASRE